MAYPEADANRIRQGQYGVPLFFVHNAAVIKTSLALMDRVRADKESTYIDGGMVQQQTKDTGRTAMAGSFAGFGHIKMTYIGQKRNGKGGII